KDQIEDFSESNNEVSLIDDDSFSIDNIDFVEASPPDSELVNSEVMEIVIPECPPSDRSDFTHEEFADELAHIISPRDIPGNVKTHTNGFCTQVFISSASIGNHYDIVETAGSGNYLRFKDLVASL
nr:hypothetical protein [Tanacetum cinerariifolium]